MAQVWLARKQIHGGEKVCAVKMPADLLGLDLGNQQALLNSVTENPYAGAGNEDIGDLTSGNQDVWFTGYGTGGLYLNTPPAIVLTTAQWSIGDPTVDIDGEPRPNRDGTADVAGADVP